MTATDQLFLLAGGRDPGLAFDVFWGGVALVAGGVLAANIRRAADWMQVISYSYRSWPQSVRTVRVIGGCMALMGAVQLGAAVFGR